MKVTVFGVGYVGLVQAAVLANVGHDVLCIDISEERIRQLNSGIMPIYEPGLDALVKDNHEEGDWSSRPITKGLIMAICC